MLSIVIPTLQNNIEVLNKLLSELVSSSVVDDIIIINNADKEFCYKSNKIRVLNQNENLFVNPAWNLGVEKAKNDIIGILNDDILFPAYILDEINNFILKESNCGLLGLDSIGVNQQNNSPDKTQTMFYPVDIRDYGWGSAIFGRKENFYKIPEKIKIWYGDDFLFKKNLENNKTNYKFSNPNIMHLHSSTSGKAIYDEIKKQDLIEYAKFDKDFENQLQKNKLKLNLAQRMFSITKQDNRIVLSLFGIKLKIKQKIKHKYDLIVSLGAACAASSTLRQSRLQFRSYPFDWLFGSEFLTRVQILSNNFSDFINKDDLEFIGTREFIEPRKIYKNKKNGIVFNHDFSLKNSLDEDYCKVEEKYQRRIKRLIKQIEQSKKVCFVYVEIPNNRKELLKKELIEAHEILKNRFQNVETDILYIFNTRGLKLENSNTTAITKNIKRASFDYDAYKKEDPSVVDLDILCAYFKNYRLSSKFFKKEIIKEKFKKFIKNIFSVRNSHNKKYKSITLFGLEFKIKRR